MVSIAGRSRRVFRVVCQAQLVTVEVMTQVAPRRQLSSKQLRDLGQHLLIRHRVTRCSRGPRAEEEDGRVLLSNSLTKVSRQGLCRVGEERSHPTSPLF